MAERSRRPGGQGRKRRAASPARRPAHQRSTSGTGAAPTKPRRDRRRGLTTRATYLALLISAMTLALTVPLRQYLQQRARVTKAAAELRAAEREVADLESQRRLLEDPAYVEARARERLHYVRPGETAYVVIDPAPSPSAFGAPRPTATRAVADEPWYAQMWSTVQGAGAGK